MDIYTVALSIHQKKSFTANVRSLCRKYDILSRNYEILISLLRDKDNDVKLFFIWWMLRATVDIYVKKFKIKCLMYRNYNMEYYKYIKGQYDISPVNR